MLSLIKMFIATFALMVASVYAQGANFRLPAANGDMSAGTNTTVQITQANSNSSWKNIAIVISIQSCPTGDCLPATEDMGTILYQGAFSPAYGTEFDIPYQDFYLQVPSTFTTGEAQLAFSLFTLIGADLYPNLQTTSEVVYVV